MKSSVIYTLILSGLFAVRCWATVYQSNGSAASVQGLHNAVLNGDTIMLPAGTFTWTTPVTISKAIKLQGAGSGRIIGDTKSQVTVGKGSKTFVTTRAGLPITAGQTLRIAKVVRPEGGGGSESNPPAFHTYMEGTVTSYSGTRLVMNITSTAGSGTWRFWTISTPSSTTILQDYDTSGGDPEGTPLIRVNQTQAGSCEIGGIKFIPTGNSFASVIGPHADAYSGPKTLIHDCWFQMDTHGGGAIVAKTNRVLVWNCSFDSRFFNTSSAIGVIWNSPVGAPSWSTNSTMGMADTNGATNFYVEDCDFHFFNTTTDFSDNARVVMRHCVLDNAGLGSHGADTGTYGLRHVELYDNELIFDNFGDCDGSTTMPVNWFFWMRGGTGVVTDNIIPAISSCPWGNKENVGVGINNIFEHAGPYCCWVGYPAPHQIGQGFGPGAVFHGLTGICDPFIGQNVSYYTYSEPLYVWNNRGTAGNGVSLHGYPDNCGNNQQLSNYIQAGRDFAQQPKPGYVKFTYPHPLAASFPPPTDTSPSVTVCSQLQQRLKPLQRRRQQLQQRHRSSRKLNRRIRRLQRQLQRQHCLNGHANTSPIC